MKTETADTHCTPNGATEPRRFGFPAGASSYTVIPLGWFRHEASSEAVAAGLAPVSYHAAEVHCYFDAAGRRLPDAGIMVDFVTRPEFEPLAARPIAEVNEAAEEALARLSAKQEVRDAD